MGTSSYTGSISPHPLLPGRAHRRHGTDPQSDAVSFFLGLPDMLPVRFTVALCLCKLHMEGRREGGMVGGGGVWLGSDFSNVQFQF